MYFRPAPVSAATHTLTSKVDFMAGHFNNAESLSKEGEIKVKPAW
jgi:hypothetical protein